MENPSFHTVSHSPMLTSRSLGEKKNQRSCIREGLGSNERRYIQGFDRPSLVLVPLQRRTAMGKLWQQSSISVIRILFYTCAPA